MGDLFGEWVPVEWINSVLDVVEQCKQHTFIFLTKNSKRLAEFSFPDNAWVGISFDGYGVEGIPQGCNAKVKFVSIEPLLTELMIEKLWGMYESAKLEEYKLEKQGEDSKPWRQHADLITHWMPPPSPPIRGIKW